MIPTRAPIKWIAGSVVYGADGFSDPWSVFSISMSSYDALPEDDKMKLLGKLRSWAYHVGHDFQLLRVGTWFDRDAYVSDRQNLKCEHPQLRDPYLAEQAMEFYGLVPGEPRLFAAISHRSPTLSKREKAADPMAMWREFKSAGRRAAESVLTLEQRDIDQREAERMFALTASYLPCTPATSEELQWLIRRCWHRGGADPIIDALDEMQAPVVVDRSGREILAPQEADLLRWTGGLEVGVRDLVVHGEDETNYQSSLVVTRLPMADEAPSDLLELALRPGSRLDFPIDLAITCEWISNRRALEAAENMITDADQDAFAEDDTERGATDEAAERPDLARDQRAYLRRARAPMLNATITAQIGASSSEQLKERTKRVQQVFEDNDCQVSRPVMQQLQAFFDGLPGQRTNLTGYKRLMTCEQFAAQAWTAKHAAGSRRGWLLGTTQTAAAAPVLFNPRDGSAHNRAAAIALFGNLGVGKTMLAQKIMYEAAIDGARIIDQDPKGDHTWHHLLPESCVETITLAPEAHLRGLLDPWRAAHPDMRSTAAMTFLQALFPARYDAAWETTLIQAVNAVQTRETSPTNVAVIRALREAGGDVGRQMAEHFEAYATAGLAQLGFASPDVDPSFGNKQVTYVQTSRLPLPNDRQDRSQYTHGEVLGSELARLLALLSMRMMEEHRSELKIYNSEEAWRILGTHEGRGVFDAQQRMGRSELAVPMLATQTTVGIGQSDEDKDAVANLFGAYFAFRPADRSEASRTLRLMGLDSGDEHMIDRLLALESGQALMKDYSGAVEFVDIHVTQSFLEHASTRPEVESAFAA